MGLLQKLYEMLSGKTNSVISVKKVKNVDFFGDAETICLHQGYHLLVHCGDFRPWSNLSLYAVLENNAIRLFIAKECSGGYDTELLLWEVNHFLDDLSTSTIMDYITEKYENGSYGDPEISYRDKEMYKGIFHKALKKNSKIRKDYREVLEMEPSERRQYSRYEIDDE